MNQTVLPQLQEIEAELASQEDQLTAQLNEINNRLNGIRAVLPMFSDTAGAVDVMPSQAAKSSKAKRTKPAETLKASAKTIKKSTKKVAEKSTKKAAKSGSAAKFEKKDGRAADWQQYVRQGVDQMSMSEAVLLILQTQPEKSFKIIDMMTAIFEDNIPRDQYLKARNRISNLLSSGVREGQWYRGERSTYRLTQ